MKTFDVTIKGVKPGLLMHRFPELTVAGLATPVKAVGKKKLTGEQEAELAAYRLESGELCQPADAIHQAMIEAAGEFQIQGRGKKTYKSVLKGLVIISPDFISHGTEEYAIDKRVVRIQKARIVRHRPHLPEWQLSFLVQVLDENLLPDEVLSAILAKAGQTIGIGDYRPRFGRFVVTRLNEAKEG